MATLDASGPSIAERTEEGGRPPTPLPPPTPRRKGEMNTEAGDLAAEAGVHGSRIKSGMTRLRRSFSNLSARLEAIAEAEREQLPLWLPVGLMLGIGAWFYLPDRFNGPPSCSRPAPPRSPRLRSAPARAGAGRWPCSALAAALGCALVWWQAERAAAPRIAREQMMDMVATIDSVQAMAAQGATRLVVRPAGEGLPVRLRINVEADKMVAGLEPGATVRVRAWVMPPAPTPVPGAYDFGRAAWFQQIGGTGRALGIEVIAPASQQSLSARLADLAPAPLRPYPHPAWRRRGRGHRRRSGHRRPIWHPRRG